MPASIPSLGDLHEALAKKLLSMLQQDDIPASLIKEVREFLKDNDIQATEGDGGATDQLADKAAKFMHLVENDQQSQ